MPAVVSGGLMEALYRYDYTLGNSFATYAMYWLRKAIRETIVTSQPLKLSHRDYWDTVSVRIAMREAEAQRLNLDDPGIAATIGRSYDGTRMTGQRVGYLRLLSYHLANIRSLHEALDPDNEGSAIVGDQLEDPAAGPEKIAILNARSNRLLELVAGLDYQSRTIINATYGLHGPPIPLVQLAHLLGLNIDTAKAQLEKGLAAIRAALSDEDRELLRG
jgi:RNA polymerase sigma factor (sigma-70 family)